MSARGLEREMAEFERLLIQHIARSVDLTVERTLHRGAEFRARAARTAILLCWRDREMFQPPEESWLRWFDDHLFEAVDWVEHGGVSFTREEIHLWAFLNRQPEPPAHLFTTDPNRYWKAAAAEATQTGDAPLNRFWFGRRGRKQDCPPCWKCRWYDGWLPPGGVIPKAEYADPEIAEACDHLDHNRVEIAMTIRSGG